MDLDQIAQTTAGFTRADLENLMNEAAIYAAKQGRIYIIQADIQQSFVKVGIGTEKKSRIVSEKRRRLRRTMNPAMLFCSICFRCGSVYSVRIIPTGVGAAGYTMPFRQRMRCFIRKARCCRISSYL